LWPSQPHTKSVSLRQEFGITAQTPMTDGSHESFWQNVPPRFAQSELSRQGTPPSALDGRLSWAAS
jgi:hypothetical protein